MRIGTMPLGEVDAHQGESVVTQFFYVGPLFFPTQSYYQCAQGALEIPMHGRSVGLGYVRIYSFLVVILAVVGLIAGFNMRGSDASTMGLASGAVLAIALPLALVSSFRWGKVSDEDAMRREVLSLLVGIGAKPEWLPSDIVKKTRRHLLEVWEANHEKWGEPADWRDSLVKGPRCRNTAWFLYGLAAYDAAHQGKAPKLAEDAWAHSLTAPQVDIETLKTEVRKSAPPKKAPKAEPAKAETPAKAGRIAVRCLCGTTSQVPARLEGKKIKCPDCQTPCRVGTMARAVA